MSSLNNEQMPLLSASKNETPPSFVSAPPSLHHGKPQGSAKQSESNADKLAQFRTALGILEPLYGASAAKPKSTGLYASILHKKRVLSVQYHLIEAVYYSLLLSQVIIGALLASLGPTSKIHHQAITIIGVINASSAGILALLKGQGLPDRLRKDEWEMEKVGDLVREWEIKLSVEGEEDSDEKGVEDIVKDILDSYNKARDTAEMNRPSSYAHQVDGTDEETGKNSKIIKGKNRMVMGKGVANGTTKSKAKFVID